MGQIQLHIRCVHSIHPEVVYTSRYLKLDNIQIWIHPYLETIQMHIYISSQHWSVPDFYIHPTLVLTCDIYPPILSQKKNRLETQGSLAHLFMRTAGSLHFWNNWNCKDIWRKMVGPTYKGSVIRHNHPHSNCICKTSKFKQSGRRCLNVHGHLCKRFILLGMGAPDQRRVAPNKMSFSARRRHLQISAILISMNLISNSVTTQYVHDCHGGSQPSTPHPWVL
jgi:hypothetical protein